MAPASYQGKTAEDAADIRTYSQTQQSNMSDANSMATVDSVLREKGNTVYTVAPHDRVSAAVSELRARGIGVMLVVEDGQLVGILSERDVVRHLDEQGAAVLDAQVSDLMTPDPFTCGPNAPLLNVLKRMADGHYRHMPVVDGEAKLIGLISIGDVVKARLRQLEYEALRMKQMIVG